MELPKIMPKIGITIRAEYQGSGLIISPTTMLPTKNVLAVRR